MYRIHINGDIEYPFIYAVSPDMKMAVNFNYRKDTGYDIYLHSLEQVDDNEKGVEN